MAKQKGTMTSFNSKFIPSQKKIDGQGTSGKLKVSGKAKGQTFATFDMPSTGVELNTQGQADFNAYKAKNFGNVDHEKH